MKTKMTTGRCCCSACLDIFWAITTATADGGRQCKRDGTGVINSIYWSLAGDMEYGKFTNRVFYHNPSGFASTSCTGTDSNGNTEIQEMIGSFSPQKYDIDDENGYVYWIGVQSGTATKIHRRPYGGVATIEDVVTLNYASGPFSGQFLGTFAYLRLDVPAGLMYMHDFFFGFPNTAFSLALDGTPPLNDLAIGFSSSETLVRIVSGGHRYSQRVSGANGLIVRQDLDGTNPTTIATHTGGSLAWRGMAISLDDAFLYTFKRDTGSVYDLIEINLSDLSQTVLIAGATSASEPYLSGPVLAF